MIIRYASQIPGRPEGEPYSSKYADRAKVGDSFEAPAEELERLARDFPGCFVDASPRTSDRQSKPATRKARSRKG